MKNLFPVLVSLMAFFAAFAADAKATRLIAFGDTPYMMPADEARFLDLVADINTLEPDFSVHIGDIKSGGSRCTDQALLHVRDLFANFADPLIYTPGDNEWTDCSRSAAGGYDPVERLDFLRQSFFSTNRSFGVKSIELARQSAQPGFEKFAENARWELDHVVYATLNVVGSNNNFLPELPKMVAEYQERNAANLAWVRQAFERAIATEAAAVVFFMQADPGFDWKPEERTGFADLIDAFAKESLIFSRPVLLVHGDTHVLTLDQPFLKYQLADVPNFMRLEVVGAPFVQGVLVDVDSSAAQPFSFRPLTQF